MSHQGKGRFATRSRFAMFTALCVLLSIVASTVAPAVALAWSPEDIIWDVLNTLGLSEKATAVKDLIQETISQVGSEGMPFATDLVDLFTSDALTGAQGTAEQIVAVIDIIQSLASTGNLALSIMKKIPLPDFKLELDLPPIAGASMAKAWIMKQDQPGRDDVLAACALIKVGAFQAVFGVTDGNPLGDIQVLAGDDHLDNSQHQAWAFFDLTRNGQSYIHGRLPLGAGALPYLVAKDYVEVGGNVVQVEVGSMTDASISLQFEVGVKANFEYIVTADCELTGNISVDVAPVEAAYIIRGATRAMTDKLKTMAADSAPGAGELSCLSLENAAEVLQAVIDYLESYSSLRPGALGSLSIGADFEAGIGVGIWDTVWDIGSASAGVSFSVPLDSLGMIGVSAVQGILDFGLEASAGFQQITSSSLDPEILGENVEEVVSDLAETLETSAMDLYNSVLDAIGATEMEVSFSVDVAGESDSDSGGSGGDGGDGGDADSTINLVSGSVTIPGGAVLKQVLTTAPGRIIESFEVLASYLAMFVEYPAGFLEKPDLTGLEDHLENIVDDLNALLEILVDGTSFELQFITPVGGIQVSFGVSAEDLVAAIEAHLANLTEFTKALMDCADQKSFDPLIDKTSSLLAGMQQVLDCFREADISLSYDIGANGDIGAEGLVTIGAGASVSVGLNPELLLMLVGLDSPTHEGQGSIGIDLSLDMEAGVSVGEFAELAITGGGGVSTNLLSVEVTEWDDAIPTFYEDRSASNANLSDVKVYTSYPVTPSLALTPPLDFNNTAYEVWIPFDANSAEFHFRTSMEDTSIWRYLYDTGYDQVKLDKDGSGTARYVLNMAGKDSSLLRIGTCSRNGTLKEYRFTVRRAPKTQLASLSVKSKKLSGEVADLSLDFSPGDYAYGLNLPSADDIQVTLTPVLDNPTQTKMTIDGTPWSSGTPWTVFPQAGPNIVVIRLTPADPRIPAGTQQIVYTVTLNRPVSSNADLARIEVLGVQIPGTENGVIENPVTTPYSFSVDDQVSNITINAVSKHNGTRITLGAGDPVSHHWATRVVPLAYGLNTIQIVVTAENGNTKFYTLEVTRKTVQLQEGYPTLSIDGTPVPLTQEAPNLFVGTVDPGTGGNATARIEVKPIVDGVRVNGEDLVDGTWAAEYELLRPIGQHTWIIRCEGSSDLQEYVILLNGSGTNDSKPAINVMTPGDQPIELLNDLYADNVTVNQVKVTVNPVDEHSLVLVNGRVASWYSGGQRFSTPVTVDLVQPATKLTITVTKGDGSNQNSYHIELYKDEAAQYDADPVSITVRRGGFAPEELYDPNAPDVYCYTVDVENRWDNVWIGMVMEREGAVAFITDPSGYNEGLVNYHLPPESYRVILRPGPNTFILTARAPTPGFVKTYTLIINRALSNDASLLNFRDGPEYGLELRTTDSEGNVVFVGRPEGYDVDKLLYELNYGNHITALGVKAIPYQSVVETSTEWPASLAVNGLSVEPGEWIDIPLEVGLNTIDITVTAPDGKTTMTYTVEATRADADPPVLVLPGTITVEATERQGSVKRARVNFSVSAYDEMDGEVGVTCNPASGSFFQKDSTNDTTTVTCSAKDSYDNVATGTFDVKVVDTTPPTISVPEKITVGAQNSDGAQVDFSGSISVTDLGMPIPVGEVTFSRAPGSLFPIGTTPVTCIAQDDEGNVAFKTFYVEVLPPQGADISPATASYDLESPDDVETVITWNDASSVSSVVCGSVTAGGSDYTVEAIGPDTSKLTLSKDFIASLGPTYGTDLEIRIRFDIGGDAVLTVGIIDTQKPTWDSASLTAAGVSDTSVTLSWTAASDGGAVTSYRIYKNGQLAGTSTTRQYTVSGLTASTTYTFKVEAGDAAGNWSNDGPSLTVTTAAGAAQDEDDDTPQTPPGTGTPGAGTSPGTETPPGTQTPPGTGSEGIGKLVVEGGAQGVDVDVKYDTAAGTASTHIDDETLKKILEASKSGGDDTGDGEGPAVAKVRIPDVDGVTTYTIGLDASSLSSAEGDSQLAVETGVGSVGLPSNMLAGTSLEGAGEVSVTMGLADKETLPEDVKAAVGDRPLISLTFEVDGEQQEWSNPDAPVTVTIPYTPTPEELANPDGITVWYIDGNGNAVAVPSGRYDPETGTVTFTVTHFSHYAVVYVEKTFEDLAGVEWARKQIEALAAKGIIRGMSDTTFSPQAQITRADFLTLLVRTLGLSAREIGRFDDVLPSDYFYEPVGIAKTLGISNGVDGKRFEPRAPITRQDMMVLTARALARVGKLSLTGSVDDLAGFMADLAGFADAEMVAPYAVESIAKLVRMGLITGSDGRINPLGNTTRAEAAVLLYRVYKMN